MDGALTVFRGPFEALEEAFAARAAELRPGPGEAPLLVVAPSRALADRLERLLAVEKGLPLLGAHFHTFRSLAAWLLEEGGPFDGTVVSDPLFHDAVVEQVLDAAPGLGPAGGDRPRGFASAVRASLRDLADAGVEPAALEEHFGGELLRDPAERARLKTMLALLSAYEARLAALGVRTPSALVRRAAELAAGSERLSAFREIFYYGFYDLTGLQLEFFEAVTAGRASRLYFPYRKDHPAFRFADDFFAQKLAAHSVADLDRPGGAATALGAALDALFDPAAPPASPAPGRVALVSASGARGEAWAAAKEAVRLAEEGIPYAEIAVVARVLEPYRAPLAEAFAAEGVPLDLGGEPVLRRPLARAALDLLTLRRADFPAATIADLAASPYFAGAASGRAALWRRLISGVGIRAGWLQWRGKLEPRLGGPVELLPHRVREGLPGFAVPAEDAAALWTFVSDLRELLVGPPAAWSARAAQARAIVEANLRLPFDADAAERGAWDAVLGALDELSLFDRLGAPCAWPDFLDAFELKLSRAVLKGGAPALGVRALDAMDARGQRFRAVVLLGLKEKLFPRVVQEDPLLRDVARAALRHPAGYWIGRKASGHEEERLLFYLAAASARERLTLIYPRSDEEGRAEVPSTYLRELCRAAGLPPPGEAGGLRVPRPPAGRLRSVAPELRTPREAVLLAALDGGAPDPALEAAGVPAARLAEGFRLAAALNARGAPGPYDGMVRPPAAELAAWRVSGLSPTALDQYERCPFQFFAERVLGLGKREEGSERGELASRERGRVYHAALERFYASLNEAVWDGREPWPPRLEAALAAVFAENDWRALGLYPLLWEAARDAMSDHLRAFVVWDFERLKGGSLRPRLFEKELRGRLEEAPLGVPWKGVADRLDLDEAGKRFRVSDYKTRASVRWGKDLIQAGVEGRVHQLPMYVLLAGEELGADWSFAEGELLFLEADDDAKRRLAFSAEAWMPQKEAFLKALAVRLEAAADGRFPIRPDEREGGHCSWCDFTTVCRKSHGPSRARAARLAPEEA